MNKKYIMTNIFFIVPIAAWLVFYGSFIINPDPFTSLFIILLLLGVLPYAILWTIAARFPDKAKYCKYISIAIIITTVLIAIKYLYFTHNSEEFLGLFLIPLIILVVILFVILMLPLSLNNCSAEKEI
jgi:hypothetical protein